MEHKNSLQELMNETLAGLKTAMAANTIIGQPIQTDEVTLIPVSRLSFGVACGGSGFATKASSANFGGGSASSAKVEPVAFLVVRGLRAAGFLTGAFFSSAGATAAFASASLTAFRMPVEE